MALEKSDLKEIKKIVGDSEDRLDKKIDTLNKELKKEVIKSKDEVLQILGQEVSDLADINRAVINKNDELGYRMRIVERRLGLRSR